MMTPEPESRALRRAFAITRLRRLFDTPLQALADPVYGVVLRAAYKHVIQQRRRPA